MRESGGYKGKRCEGWGLGGSCFKGGGKGIIEVKEGLNE